jgi:hypothetical protein
MKKRICFLGCLVVSAFSFIAVTSSTARDTTMLVPPLAPAPPPVLDHVPNLPVKQQPTQITFDGCPPNGDGGDRALNRLKNRVDTGDYVAVSFQALMDLEWAVAIERHNRSTWSAADKADIKKFEGVPITVEGFLAKVKEEGPESCNCHGAQRKNHDFHMWLTESADDDRDSSVVVETTPRVRRQHPSWTLGKLQSISNGHEPVRISGWLMFDQEHPEQYAVTRATLWEIHPITKIEIKQGGDWVEL